MNGKRKNIEKLAQGLPAPPLPERVWDAVERGIREPQRKSPGRSPREYFRYAVAACLVLAALSVWYINPFNGEEAAVVTTTETELLVQSADDDLDMAIMYYERAIKKLERAGVQPSKSMPPEIAALYTEKIVELKSSIAECKEALKYNRMHVSVRTALYTSYIELEQTLTEMNERTTTRTEKGS